MFKKFSSKQRLFIVLGLLSLASFAFIASNLRPSKKDLTALPTPTPAPPIGSEIPQIASIKPEKYTYAPILTSFPFPAALPVYSISPSKPVFLNPLFKQFISIYKLEPSPSSPDYYYSKDKSIILLFDSKNQYLTYTVDGMVSPSSYTGSHNPNLNSALQAAEKFLAQFPDYKNLEPQKDQITYMQVQSVGSEPKVVTNSTQANMISIPFTQYVSGYPYRFSSSTSAPVLITVGQNNQITRAYFSPQPVPNLSHPQNYPLLNSNQILSALNSGQGTVLYAPLYYLPGDTTSVPPTSLINIQLEYRLNSQTNQLIPYYLLTGQFLQNPSATVPISIQILLPAVKL